MAGYRTLTGYSERAALVKIGRCNSNCFTFFCFLLFWRGNFQLEKQTTVGAGMETRGVNNAYGGSGLFMPTSNLSLRRCREVKNAP